MHQHYSLSVVGNVNVQPVTLADAKTWLRIDPTAPSDEDATINALVQAARHACETFTGRSFALTRYRMQLDHFPLYPGQVYGPGNPGILTPITSSQWPLYSSAWALRLPRSPLVTDSGSNAVSVTYVDTSGNTQTLDPTTYIVDGDSEPARITTTQGGFWPGTLYQPKAVTVLFTAGYKTPADVPPLATIAMRELVTFYYLNRGEQHNDIPGGVKNLLYPLKIIQL